jgi:gamma-glutamyl-gamma-aminobutyrate hydrolase PuuD
VDPEKDDFERKVFHKFWKAGKKIFGICRGFQLIVREFMRLNYRPHNEWFSFYQHINHHSLAEDLGLQRNIRAHDVTYNGALYKEEGKKRQMFVNSMHHQALLLDLPSVGKQRKNKKVAKVSKSPLDVMAEEGNLIEVLAVTNYGLKDKDTSIVVEAFSICEGRIMAVQWHPEELKDYKLIRSFFDLKVEGKDKTTGVSNE